MEQDRVRQRSVDALQRLYTIVIGLALTEGARRVIDPDFLTRAALNNLRVSTSVLWILFVALVATVVPFYHGANRHLDDAYLFESDQGKSKGGLILDFFVLFGEGVLFVMMGVSVLDPQTFFNLFLLLLLLDAVWALISLLNRGLSSPLMKWCGINVAFLVLVWIAVRTPLLAAEDRPITVLLLAVVRTLVDYWQSWAFYMGDKPAPAA